MARRTKPNRPAADVRAQEIVSHEDVTYGDVVRCSGGKLWSASIRITGNWMFMPVVRDDGLPETDPLRYWARGAHEFVDGPWTMVRRQRDVVYGRGGGAPVADPVGGEG